MWASKLHRRSKSPASLLEHGGGMDEVNGSSPCLH